MSEIEEKVREILKSHYKLDDNFDYESSSYKDLSGRFIALIKAREGELEKDITYRSKLAHDIKQEASGRIESLESQLQQAREEIERLKRYNDEYAVDGICLDYDLTERLNALTAQLKEAKSREKVVIDLLQSHGCDGLSYDCICCAVLKKLRGDE